MVRGFDKASYLAAWQSQVALLRSVVAEADPSTATPSCPDWTLADLLRHVTAVTTRYCSRTRTATAPGYDSLPEVTGDPLEAYDTACNELASVFNGVSMTDPAWNPTAQPNLAGFWLRRAMCELAVHRWDAQLAVAAPEPIDTPVAVEGIQEAVEALLPAGWRRRGDVAANGLVEFAAKDTNRRWYIRMRGDNISILDFPIIDAEHPVNTRATGTASDLLLALWGRVPYEVLDVEGDAELLAAMRLS